MWSAVHNALGRNYRKKIRNEGCEKTSSQVIAEEFNTYFSNCAKESNKDNNSGKGHSIPCLPKAPTVFHFKRIDKDMVLNYLGKLNKKASGTDNISAKLLKMTASGIAESLTNLFNLQPRDKDTQ